MASAEIRIGIDKKEIRDYIEERLRPVIADLAAWEHWADTWLADYPDGQTPRMQELRAALAAPASRDAQ